MIPQERYRLRQYGVSSRLSRYSEHRSLQSYRGQRSSLGFPGKVVRLCFA